jgi:hypothetical protein
MERERNVGRRSNPAADICSTKEFAMRRLGIIAAAVCSISILAAGGGAAQRTPLRLLDNAQVAAGATTSVDVTPVRIGYGWRGGGYYPGWNRPYYGGGYRGGYYGSYYRPYYGGYYGGYRPYYGGYYNAYRPYYGGYWRY